MYLQQPRFRDEVNLPVNKGEISRQLTRLSSQMYIVHEWHSILQGSVYYEFSAWEDGSRESEGVFFSFSFYLQHYSVARDEDHTIQIMSGLDARLSDFSRELSALHVNMSTPMTTYAHAQLLFSPTSYWKTRWRFFYKNGILISYQPLFLNFYIYNHRLFMNYYLQCVYSKKIMK